MHLIIFTLNFRRLEYKGTKYFRDADEINYQDWLSFYPELEEKTARENEENKMRVWEKQWEEYHSWAPEARKIGLIDKMKLWASSGMITQWHLKNVLQQPNDCVTQLS